MVDLPNPALRGVLLRTLGPLVPVWLFGLVTALVLDMLGLTGGPLPLPNLELFLAMDTVLVVALMLLLATYQYRSTPGELRVDLEGVTAWLPRSGGERDRNRRRVLFPYESLRTVVRGSLFGYRVEAREAPSGPVDWLNLTSSNATVVAAAWEAWRDRQRGDAT